MGDERNSAALAVDLDRAIQRLRGRLRSQSLANPTRWTRSQLAVLDRIAHSAPGTASELAAAEYMRPQSIAQIVAALEGGGLVRRDPDPGDGRRMLVTATEEGRRTVRATLELRSAWLAAAIEQELNDDQRATVPSVIAVLNRLAAKGS